ncbi:MAG: hypothetical protein WAJ85_10915 [Candidatus Baltobacteraceae bacterium]
MIAKETVEISRYAAGHVADTLLGYPTGGGPHWRTFSVATAHEGMRKSDAECFIEAEDARELAEAHEWLAAALWQCNADTIYVDGFPIPLQADTAKRLALTLQGNIEGAAFFRRCAIEYRRDAMRNPHLNDGLNVTGPEAYEQLAETHEHLAAVLQHVAGMHNRCDSE